MIIRHGFKLHLIPQLASSIGKKNFKNLSTWPLISHFPIKFFDLDDLNINQKFMSIQKKIFDQLPPDLYEVRREQIDFFSEILPQKHLEKFNKLKFYSGELPASDIDKIVDMLSFEEQEKFKTILPYRFRVISRFNVDVMKEKVSRILMQPFIQAEANKAFQPQDDWRKLPRVFEELSQEESYENSIKEILLKLSKKLLPFYNRRTAYDITVHHVKVVSTPKRIRSNSPEGVHQDGYPFLVTALVIEREGIEGGETQIFDDDKTSKIFTGVLKPGQGILQPDLGTRLWHQVTELHPTGERGHRSVIGFDIKMIEN